MADLIDRSATSAEMVKHAKSTTVIGGQTFRTIKLEDALDAIAALPAQGVRVKPLVWDNYSQESFTAETTLGDYVVEFHGGEGWGMWTPDEGELAPDAHSWHQTEQAAKLAAQSHYAHHILAALAPAEAGGVEGLQAAGRDMLALHDGFLNGADVDHPAANRLHLAASFGAQAFAVCPIPDARPAAMIRAIALALIDPMHSDLDYLRRVNIARPVEAPMMTDLMVDPESIDDFLAAIPLPPTQIDDSEQPETAINPAPVDALVKAAEAFSDAYRTWSMIRRDGPGEALAFEQMHRLKVDMDAALAAIREGRT